MISIYRLSSENAFDFNKNLIGTVSERLDIHMKRAPVLVGFREYKSQPACGKRALEVRVDSPGKMAGMIQKKNACVIKMGERKGGPYGEGMQQNLCNILRLQYQRDSSMQFFSKSTQRDICPFLDHKNPLRQMEHDGLGLVPLRMELCLSWHRNVDAVIGGTCLRQVVIQFLKLLPLYGQGMVNQFCAEVNDAILNLHSTSSSQNTIPVRTGTGSYTLLPDFQRAGVKGLLRQ